MILKQSLINVGSLVWLKSIAWHLVMNMSSILNQETIVSQPVCPVKLDIWCFDLWNLIQLLFWKYSIHICLTYWTFLFLFNKIWQMQFTITRILGSKKMRNISYLRSATKWCTMISWKCFLLGDQIRGKIFTWRREKSCFTWGKETCSCPSWPMVISGKIRLNLWCWPPSPWNAFD